MQQLVALNSFFLLLTISTNLGLGIFILRRSFRTPANLLFFCLTAALSAWSFSIFRLGVSAGPAQAYFWALCANISAAFIPVFFLNFSLAFPWEEKHFALPVRVMWYLPACLLGLAVKAGWIIKAVVSAGRGYNVVPGPFFVLYVSYFAVYFALSFISFYRKGSKFSGTIKMQIRYMFLGAGFTAVLAIVTNLIMPLFGDPGLTGIGPYFTVIFVVFTAYAILKHRLMSIEVVIQRSTVYAVTTILIMSFYALAVMISEIYLRQIIGYSSLIVTAFAALIIAVIYQPLVKSFQNLTDRIFFRGRYDYQKTLRQISQSIAAVIKLEELTRLIVSSFIDTMKVSEISFLLKEREGDHFRSVPLALPRYKRIEIDADNPIIIRLLLGRDILVLDEIEEEIARIDPSDEFGAQRKMILEAARGAMERLGIPVWVPIISKDKIIGIIALGNKLSGDIFTSEDIGLIGTLASQVAVALDNARLYDEVLTMKNYSEEILHSMTNGVLTTDSRGKIVTYNYMAERITGRKTNDVLGKTCEEVWGKRGTICQAVENTLKDRPLTNSESGISSPERGLVPVALSSTLLRDGQSKKMGVLISIQDLSEMKELEDKIRRADKLTALATMAAGMAHEIKNPLSSMKVFAQLLPTKYDDPEYRKKLGEILPREIDRIDRIVESLLGFARATAPTFQKLSISGLLGETLNDYGDQIKSAGVKVNLSYGDLPEIEVDKDQILQAFSNLILNAIQAMPEGGELGIKTFPGKKVEDLLQTIKIQITDSGHGISEEMQKKLFDPFFTTKYGGTGLGLTITHSIIDGHKGLIDVESQVGKGTVFTITLPVKQTAV